MAYNFHYYIDIDITNIDTNAHAQLVNDFINFLSRKLKVWNLVTENEVSIEVECESRKWGDSWREELNEYARRFTETGATFTGEGYLSHANGYEEYWSFGRELSPMGQGL